MHIFRRRKTTAACVLGSRDCRKRVRPSRRWRSYGDPVRWRPAEAPGFIKLLPVLSTTPRRASAQRDFWSFRHAVLAHEVYSRQGCPDNRSMRQAPQFYPRGASPPRSRQYRPSSNHALEGAWASVGVRTSVGVLAAARAVAHRADSARASGARAVAALAAAARAAAAGAIIAAARAAATGANEARTVKTGHNGGCEAGGRRPAGTGEAVGSVHARATEAVQVAGAL
jgi:hypothetical protein